VRAFPLLFLLLIGCKKDAPDLVVPDQLPPATQTGANTFGCLLNGQAWLPSGGGLSGPFRVTYDPGYAGGSLQLRINRAVAGLPDGQYMFIGGSSVNKIGSYAASNAGPAGIYFDTGRQSGPCQEYDFFNNAPGFLMKGQLTITRLDMQAGIISGTFDFTLAQTGCDTLKITQGRFDKKL